MSWVCMSFTINDGNQSKTDCSLCSVEIQVNPTASSYNTSGLINHRRLKIKLSMRYQLLQKNLKNTAAANPATNLDQVCKNAYNQLKIIALTQYAVPDNQPLLIIDSDGFRHFKNHEQWRGGLHLTVEQKIRFLYSLIA